MALGVALFLFAFGLAPDASTLLGASLLGGIIALPCAALGLLASTFVKNMNQFQSVYSFVIAPMFYLSGIFFPTDPMPKTFQVLVQLSPFTHGVKLMQLLFWKQMTLETLVYHGGILVVFSVGLGLWSNSRVRAQLIS